MKNYLKL